MLVELLIELLGTALGPWQLPEPSQKAMEQLDPSRKNQATFPGDQRQGQSPCYSWRSPTHEAPKAWRPRGPHLGVDWLPDWWMPDGSLAEGGRLGPISYRGSKRETDHPCAICPQQKPHAAATECRLSHLGECQGTNGENRHHRLPGGRRAKSVQQSLD